MTGEETRPIRKSFLVRIISFLFEVYFEDVLLDVQWGPEKKEPPFD